MARKIEAHFARVPLLVKVNSTLPTSLRWGLTLDEARELTRQLNLAINAGDTYRQEQAREPV